MQMPMHPPLCIYPVDKVLEEQNHIQICYYNIIIAQN